MIKYLFFNHFLDTFLMKDDQKGVGYIVAVTLTVLVLTAVSLVIWGHLTSITEPLGYKWRAVGVKVYENQINHIELSYIGGKYHKDLSRLIIRGQNANGDYMKFYSSANASHSDPSSAVEVLYLNNPPVGTIICTENGTIGKDHITVIAEFKDGTRIIVLDTLV
jgi:hypothetical protein